MPICEITYADDVLAKDERGKIVERVSALLLKSEGLPDNPVARSICLVDFRESEAMYIGGKAAGDGKIVIKVHVFYDAYSDAVKEKLYTELTDIFIEESRITRKLMGNNIWCVIVPIQTNNFGVGGKPVSLELTRKFVFIEQVKKH